MINEQNIFEKGILISLRTGRFEGISKLAKDQLKDLPTEIVRGHHDLFKKAFKDKLNGISAFDSRARDEVKRQAIPFPIEGLYFIKMDRVTGILEYLEDCEQRRKDLVTKILENYQEAIQEFAGDYPEYYNRSKHKYPSAARLEERYFFKFQFVKIGAPDKNSVISADQYKKELSKFKDTIDEMKRDVVATIYQELLERTATLKKQCADGKPNQLTFNALGEFLKKVDDLYSDFIDRDDMKEAILKIKAQLLGVTADGLRDNTRSREDFRKSIAGLAEEIKALPDIKLNRALEF
jgi:hypothetical protein